MTQSKKQLISLCVMFSLLAVFGVVYVIGAARQGRLEEREAAEWAAEMEEAMLAFDALQMVARTELGLERVSFTAEDHAFTIELVRGDEDAAAFLVYAEHPDVELHQHNTRAMLRDVYMLTATEIAADGGINPDDFGIGQVVATAYFEDGSRETVRLGTVTPDHSSFYAMVDGNPALFLLGIPTGLRLMQNVTALVDRSMPIVNIDRLVHVYMSERDRQAVEFEFLGEDFLIDFHYNSGMMTMTKPFEGRDISFMNFEHFVIDRLAGFAPRGTATLFPDDLSQYGLDDPVLEMIMEDTEGGRFHAKFGNARADGFVYMMYGGQSHVFLAERHFVDALLGINPFFLIDRFVALVNIDRAERVVIESATRGDFDIFVNHYRDDRNIMQMAPTINGQEVDADGFRQLYQSMIGIALDFEAEWEGEPGEPDIVISYYLLARREDEPHAVVEFFVYDANFYAVRRRGEPLQFVTSRFDVDVVFEGIAGLLE